MSENSIRVATMNAANLGNGKKPSRSGKIKKRPGLKTLQPSANNTKQVVGNKRENFFTPKKSQKRKLDDEIQSDGTPTKIARVIKPKPPSEVKIFQDPELENDTIDKEAYELMVQETVPESYWEEVAEQRRVALADALDENEKLHTQIDHLKEENRRLSAVAEQAEYFASVVKMLTEDDDKPDEDKNDEDVNETIAKASDNDDGVFESEAGNNDNVISDSESSDTDTMSDP